jgi:hypothetical protein
LLSFTLVQRAPYVARAVHTFIFFFLDAKPRWSKQGMVHGRGIHLQVFASVRFEQIMVIGGKRVYKQKVN